MSTGADDGAPAGVPPDPRKRLGARGERLAREALEARGFRILEANHRTRYGEIDLIALKDSALWIVEVKTRRTKTFGPVEVSAAQRHRLNRMALCYLARVRFPFETVQFVVAAVTFLQGQPQIEWIEQAFEGAF